MTMRRSEGFTLIEILLAMVLLATGLALAFSTLRAATAIVGRGEVIAQRNERMRAVDGFLRRRIADAQMITFRIDERDGLQHRFSGDATHMRFVSDLPNYLGRGGPYLHELSVADNGKQLMVSFTMVQAGQVVQDRYARPPEALAEGLRSVAFRYRGMNDIGDALGDWQDEWTAVDVLPIQVKIDIEWADRSKWPPLVVTLARGSARPGSIRSGMP
ncbi:MAG: prepilin-type N-terminal cleavage/methylation domain-containing protein [Xanthomonadaceae bacterium]|jgi:general secretion pathway protein J|nr:prepilin-type N-terminal cleavage/methylation domain-containing protein [Xanthomonadaceae bacterium]